MRAKILSVLLFFPALAIAQPVAAAEPIDVKIVDRQTSEANYTYAIPGHLFAQSSSNANCSTLGNAANCSGSAITTGVITPARSGSYSVIGATFTLKLPDDRLVVVNCESKYALRGDYVNRRSCRMPLVDDIRVEFRGDKAKLIWPVSIDGRKTENETYKILAIFE